MAVETEIERMVVRLIGDSQSYMKMMKDAEDQAGKTAATITNHTKTMENMSKTLKSFGSSMSMYVTAPLTGLGAVASYEYGKYEAALAKITSMVLVSKEEVDEYSETIKKLAIETGKSPTELAEALENITSSNVKGAAALELLTIAAKAGTAGLGEVRSVTVAATTAMNVFKGQNLGASDAVNILTRAVQEGSAEAEAFAPVIGDVAQAANALGLDFETAAGMVAFLSRTAGSAGQAATQAKGLMLQILRLKPEGKAAEALEAIGFSADMLREKIRGSGDLVGAMNELDAALKANGMTMNQVFTDSEALMGALSIVGDNAQSAADVMENVRKRTDSVGTAFEAVADTSKVKMAQVAAEAKINMIELGSMLTEVRDITINMTHYLQQAWSGADAETKKYIVTLAVVLVAIGPISMALGKLASAFVMVSKAITMVSAAITFMTTKGVMLLATGAAVTMWVTVFVGGVYLLTKAFSYLVEKVMGYNKAIREGLELSKSLEGAMADKTSNSQSNVLAQASGMQGEDKRSFLTDQLEQAKKNAAGYEGQVRGATAEVERLNTVWNRWTGNKVLEVAKEDLEEVKARAKASSEWAARLEEELNGIPTVEEALSGGGTGEKPIDPELQEKVDELSASMKLQAETVGMTSREIEIYKLKQQGALTGMLELLAVEEKARIKAEETAKAAKDLTDNLSIQAATMHMTSTEAEIYKLKQKGLTEEQLKSIKAADEAVKAAEKQKAMLEKAKGLTEQYMSSEDKFKKGQEELQKMLDGGHITLDTYNKALEDLYKQTDKDYGVDLSPKGIQALEAGSAEALAALENYRAVMKMPPGGGPSDVIDSNVVQSPIEIAQQHSGPPQLEAVDQVKNMLGDMNRNNSGNDLMQTLIEIKIATQKTAEKEPIELAEAGL